MSSYSIYTENYYREHFQQLLDFQEETSLYTLTFLKEEHSPPQHLFGTVISSLQSRFSLAESSNKLLTRGLKATIRQWHEKLDELLEEARYNPVNLSVLKKAVTPLLIEEKTTLLIDKITCQGITNPRLIQEIRLLEKLIERTVQVPEPKTLPPIFFHATMGLNPSIPSIADYGKKLNDSHIVAIKKEQRKREIGRTVERLCNHSHDKEKEWRASLIKSFEGITDVEAIKSLGNTIQSLQVLELLRNFINNREHENKLIYLMGGLPFNKFGEILLSLETGELTALNRIFKNSQESERAWLEERITEHRDQFVDACNHLKVQIDTLCSDFRKDSRGVSLNDTDINDIHVLSGEIELRSEQISKLGILYQEIILHPETNHLLGEGLKKEYLNLRIRLSSKEHSENRPAGCVWGILYRNVFDRCDLDDQDEAFEILADWSICKAEDYREIGLLGKINDTTFENLQKEKKVFHQTVENLKRLGIETISDWKSKNIFNKKMLGKYLRRKEIQALLPNED